MDLMYLEHTLKSHSLWLGSDKKEGERANLQEAALRGASLQGVNLQRADFQRTDLQRADLRGASLQKANFQGANFQGANLRGANLWGAYLRGANLRGAYLRGAHLLGANLENTEVIAFFLGRRFGFAHFGPQYEDGSYVQIGCEGHSLPHWLKHFQEIGKAADYTEKDIQFYGDFLNLLYKRAEK